MKVLIAMLRDQDVVKPWVAVQVIAQFKEASAVESLVAALQDEDESEREAAEDALEGVGDPEAEQALAEYREQESKG